jgi:hypothetical protein
MLPTRKQAFACGVFTCMRKSTFATVAAAGLAALSLALAAPAVADDWDNTPVVTGNDTPFYSGGPASELPATSAGANPFVPLGPGH